MEVLLLAVICLAIIGSAVVHSRVQRKNTETLEQIHKLVNSRLTEALDDITALKKALVDERRAKGSKR